MYTYFREKDIAMPESASVLYSADSRGFPFTRVDLLSGHEK
jgi:hypothetical protein